MTSCVLIPTKKNVNTNQEEESRLFSSLLSLVDKSKEHRSTVVSLYLKFTNPDFIKEYSDKLSFDELEEPTIESLLSFTNLESYLDKNELESKIQKELGKLEEDDTIDNYEKMLDKMIDFNNNSIYRNARVVEVKRVVTDNGSKLRFSIEERNDTNISKAKDAEKAYQLNNKIKNILKKKGVDVVAYDGLFDSLAATATTRFEASKQAANGVSTIIQLANDSIGAANLPEEFSHYIFETFANESVTQRLVSYVSKYGLAKDILGESYESYYERYNGNENSLIHEAIAHLIREEILLNHGITDGTLNSLTERLKSIFKSKFSSISNQEIDSAIKTIVDDIEDISKKAFDETVELKKEITTGVSFDAIDAKIQRDIDLLEKIINTEVKKAYIYDRSADKEWLDKRKEFIDKLQRHKDSSKHTQVLGIYTFLAQITKEFSQLKDRLEKIEVKENENFVTIKARMLRQIKDYMSSYTGVLHEIQSVIRQNLEDDEHYYDININGATVNVKNVVDDCVGALSYLENIYNQQAAALFIDFAKRFMGDNIVIPFDDAIKGKKKGEIVSIDDFYDTNTGRFKDVADITFLDRWLNSMSYSHDWFNKIFATSVKEQNTKTRLETLDMSKRILAIGSKLEKLGLKDLSFVFERDNEGNLTLNFISETNWGQYRKDKAAKWAELEKKYGNYHELSIKKQKEFKEEYNAWIDDNTRFDKKEGYRKPKSKPGEKYYNNEFEKLKRDKDRYNAYKELVAIKSELDSYLPISGQARHQVPIILKDFIERAKGVSDIQSGWNFVVESLRDEVMRRSGNIEYGTEDFDLYDDEMRDAPYITRPLDFENQPINVLPIYYQRLRGDVHDKKTGRLIQRGDNANDVSTDIISTLIAYAHMAYNYKNMNEIVDVLEIGRDVLDDPVYGQKISIEENGVPVVDKINHLGRSIIAKGASNKDSYARRQRDDFFASQIYGRYFANEGTMKILGKSFDKNKLANLSNKLTSLNGLAFNPLAGITNIDQGVITMNIEAVSREFFNEKNLFHADVKYARLLPECIAQIGERVKTNKLDLLMEKYNTLQDYDQKIRDVNFDRRNYILRMFGSNFLYLFNNAGEHWMQNRTFFSLCDSDNEQLIDKDGKKISIDEANEVKFIQEDGSLGDTDMGLGAKLVLKEGLSLHDGTKIITEEQIKRGHKVIDGEMEEWKFTNYISRKCATINQRMHGIYNNEDMNAFQRLAIGRMVMIFRKWIVPSFEKRYDSANYNFETKSWNEGYYRTAVRVFKRAVDDIKQGQFVYATFKDQMTDQEKQNMRRCLMEVAQFVAILGSLAILGNLDDDDSGDENKDWFVNIVKYQLYRMRTEMGALMPTPYLPQEFFRLVQTPTADVRLWQTTLDLIQLLNPYGWNTDEDHAIQSGRFKGHSKNYRTLHKSILDPFENDLYNIIHPWEPLAFYK